MGLRPYLFGEIRMGIPHLSYSKKSNCLYGLFARFLNFIFKITSLKESMIFSDNTTPDVS